MAHDKENIYKRKDGRWEGRYRKGRKQNGEISYGYIYRRSYRETQRALHIKKLEMTSSEATHFSGTCQEWFHLWLIHDVKERVKDSTFHSYQHKCKKYILPKIGDIPLQQLTTTHVQKLVTQWSSQFAGSTVNVLFRMLNCSLKLAAAQHYLTHNPCDDVVFP